MSKRLLVVLSVLSIIALVVGGCQNQPTVEEIVAKMREIEASTEDAHGVVELAVHNLGADAEMVVEVWEKRPNKTRIEMVESSEPDYAGAVMVADGEQVWVYFPEENRVRAGEVGSHEPSSPREIVQFMDEILERVLDTSDVRLVGEEDVAGTPTYKLEFSPREGHDTLLPGGSTITLWVDQERWVVLQAQFSGGAAGEGWMHVRSYELNTGLPDSIFEFEVPEGAHVTQVEHREFVPLTLDEAKAQAEFLMVPAYVPEGTTLINVFALDETLGLYYDHSGTSFTVMQGPAPGPEHKPLGRTTEVTVRGQLASLTTDAVLGTSLLTWTENGITITVAGQISEGEVLRVAESLQ
jgi:outer membrane lipoprotein-sorting protein